MVPWISTWASVLQPHEGSLFPAWDEGECVLLVFVMKIREDHKSFQENCRAILQG